jgi:SAM-dependent methyltransferase
MKNTRDSSGLDVACPACNSKKNTIVAKYSSNDSLKHLSIAPLKNGYEVLKNQIIERWNGDVCNFVECSNCSLEFASPFVAGSKELYSFFYNSPETGGSINWEHITAENLILKKFSGEELRNVKLLEFGAGDGAFIKDMGKKGLELNNIIGTEASQSCRNALNDLGINCLSNELSLLHNTEFQNKFDVIALFQVLEHLDDIDNIFNTINYISKKNSSLIIAVPNNVIRKYYEENRIFLDVPPIHISRWNEQSFKLIGAKYGWKIKDYEIEKITFFSSAYNFIWNKSLSKSVGEIKKRYIRKPLIALLIIPLFILNFFKIIKIKQASNGISQLVHLEKI